LKIAFFTARYSRSGVPLAQIRLAKSFARHGNEVDFIIGYVPAGLKLPILEGMNTIIMDHSRVIMMVFPIMKYFLFNKANIVFSAEDHLNVVVLLSAILTRTRAKISISSRISVTRVYSRKIFSKNWFLEQFLRVVQIRANALVCVSKDMAKEYNTIFKTHRYKCIYNIVYDSEAVQKMSKSVDDLWITDKSKPLIISAGSLNRRKGFHDLILSVKELIKTVDVRLLILGEGPRREELSALIVKENLGSFIRLAGYKENPLKYFSQADVFVLASYAEGLPNVLVEAMMCGCTPVATDCPTGPREVLKDGRYGYLIPMHNPEAMAAAIKNALENPIPPQLLKEAVKPFAEEEIFSKHKNVLAF